MNTLTTRENAEVLKAELLKLFPVAGVTYYNLGGDERASLGFSVSKDPRETWPNKIFENSAGAKFMLDADGSLKMLTRNKVAKFRATRVTSIAQVVMKIAQWAQKPAEA